MACILALALLAAAAAPAAAATTYYISPLGSDAAAGTSPAAPWRTAAPASALLLRPGDAILFDAAHGPHELGARGLLAQAAPNTNTTGITIAAYGAAAPGLRATLRVDASQSWGVRAVDLGAAIANLSLAHTGAAQAAYNGIEALRTNQPAQAAGLSIRDCDVAGFLNGVVLSAAGCAGFAGPVIERVEAWGSLGSGITSWGPAGCFAHSQPLVRNCTARDNPGDPGNARSWSGSGIVLSSVDGALITGCVAARNGAGNGHAGGGPVGIWLYDARDSAITHCASHSNANGHPDGSGNDGGGFDLDGGCQGCTIEHCLAFNNSGPGFLVCSFGGALATRNNTVRFSVSLGDGHTCSNGAGGLNWFTPDTLVGLAAVGNTLVSLGAAQPLVGPLLYGNPAQALALRRNALLALGGAPLLRVEAPALPAPGSALVAGNAFWAGARGAFEVEWGGGRYASLAALRAGTGLEDPSAGGSDSDPGAVPSDWFAACVPGWVGAPLVPNSPALDAARGFAGCAKGSW
jgi:hypothetical protein